VSPAKAPEQWCPHCSVLFPAWDLLVAHVYEQHGRRLYATSQDRKQYERGNR
jgi:hypothetical protein